MNKKIKILISIIVIIVLIIGGFLIYNGLNKKDKKIKNEPQVINEIKDYNYVLKDNSTKSYNDLFKMLKEELEKSKVDESKYLELISKMFIIDFFTLDNKIDNTDIGGVMFLEESIINNFKLSATDTIYKYVENNVYHDRKQELPIVSEVIINKTDTTSFNEDPNAFIVDCTIKYEKDLDYKENVKLTFIHKDKKLLLVEIN